MQTHETWMRLAWELAKAATGQTGSNPMVGAVVVKDGRMVGMGAHLQAGTAHAEVHALQMAGEKAHGGTIYVTLEPCNHYGKTPPCTEAILQAGIQHVVIGSLDPDPQVSGQGIARLQSAGIEVITDVLEQLCLQMNEAYFHHRQTGLPFVTLKTATTLDGKTATYTGDSRWITNQTSRAQVHKMRHQYQAILVGSGTALADDPQLTARLQAGANQPLRILVDSHLRIPLSANLIDISQAETWIFTTKQAMNTSKATQLQQKGIQVIPCGSDAKVDLQKVLQVLGKAGILSVLVEGGSEINAAFLALNQVQKVVAFIAPKLLGGQMSLTSFSGESPQLMTEAKTLHNLTIEQFDNDFCITGYLN